MSVFGLIVLRVSCPEFENLQLACTSNKSTNQKINTDLPLMIFVYGCPRMFSCCFQHPERHLPGAVV